MKKTICIVLSIMLLMTSFIGSFADNTSIDKLEMNEAAAYGEVLRDITARLEDASDDGLYTLSFKSEMPFGISYAKLIDFDDSNVPELFVFYMCDSKYNYEVWTLDDNGYALQLSAEEFDLKNDSQDEETVYLAHHGDISELVFYKTGVEDLDERITVYSLNDGEWENTKTYERSTVIREDDEGEEAEYAKCVAKLDGEDEEITIREYDAVKGIYVNDSLDELYKYNSENDELYISKLKTDVNQAEKLNELASQISAFVNSMQNKAIEEYSYADIFSSLSNDERTYLTSLFTYFSENGFKGNVNLLGAYNKIVDYVAYKSAKDDLIKVFTSTESEDFVLMDKSEVDIEIFKRLGFYPSEIFYNENSTNGNFTRDGYYHLKDEPFNREKHSYQPQKMYKISDDIYLVTFNVFTWESTSPVYNDADGSLYIDDWNDKVKEGAMYNNNGYAIVEKTSYTDYPYFIREMKVGGVYPSEKYLENHVAIEQETLLNFNYQLSELSVESFIKETESQLLLLDILVGFADQEKIAEYIEYAIESLCSVSVRVQNNAVNLNNSAIEKISTAIDEVSGKFDSLLNTYNIKLARPYKKIAKVHISNISNKKSVTVDLSKDLLKINADAIKFVLSQDNYYVQIDTDDLKEIIEKNGRTQMKITNLDEVYKVEFIASGKNIKKLAGKVKLSVPAKDNLSTVYLYTDEYDMQIGGQYNAISGGVNASGSIEFYVTYPGEYIVEDGDKTISDIKLLTVADADIVKFIISKNIMSLEEGAFNPNAPMTKKELAKAIVNICYLHNLEAQSDFIDVSEDDLYYQYISSALENEYFEESENGIFEPDKSVTREEFISVIAKILVNQKGYLLPVRSTSESYFDYSSISQWDMQDAQIALVASLGIIDEGGLLKPQTELTRLDAATMLYKLNNVINDVPDAVSFTNSNVISQYGWIIALVVLIIIIAAVTVAIVIIVKRKKKKMLRNA